jgi:hypothetical protein
VTNAPSYNTAILIMDVKTFKALALIFNLFFKFENKNQYIKLSKQTL